jgi:hypothetical protein
MDDYDWGLTPERLAGLKKDMSVSVAVSISRDNALALEAALDEKHIERGTE